MGGGLPRSRVPCPVITLGSVSREEVAAVFPFLAEIYGTVADLQQRELEGSGA